MPLVLEANLQDLARDQVLNDLAQQLDDLAVAQRRQRHAGPRQQEVPGQNSNLQSHSGV